MKGRNILPMAVAAVIALGITVAARWLIPSGRTDYGARKSNTKIPMPDIPLMVKETKKVEEVMVLVTDREIKRGGKITAEVLSWKKWPKEALQPNFIAKDLKGNPLNNSGDYRLALTMWAGTNIALGIPISVSMLLSYDPIKREQEEKAKAEAEKKKKREAELAKQREKAQQEFVKSGMRALTFPVEQRSATGLAMLSPGDLVDVLVTEVVNGKSKIHKYPGMRVLAIDGATQKRTEAPKKEEKGSIFGITTSISNAFSAPKNVTLEVREALVEKLLKEVGGGSVVLSVRNQADKSAKDGMGDTSNSGEEEEERVANLMKVMSATNQTSVVKSLQGSDAAEVNRQKDIERVMLSMQNRNALLEANAQTPKVEEASESDKEIVSGKIVSAEGQKDASSEKDTPKKPQSIRVTKGTSTSVITLDEEGKNSGNSGGSGLSGGLGGLVRGR